MKRERILIIDDDAQNLKLSRVLLSRYGYELRTATDAQEALAVLETFTPRLILLDLQLPGMDGYELARRLKADPRTSEIVILAVTAYAMKGDAERAQEAGCDGYVTKPIDTKTLPSVIANYVMRATPHWLN